MVIPHRTGHVGGGATYPVSRGNRQISYLAVRVGNSGPIRPLSSAGRPEADTAARFMCLLANEPQDHF